MHALAMPDDVTREPGAPIGPDEIDPDLIRLGRGVPQIGLVSAAGVIILCVALFVRLRHDFAYARERGTPRAVTVASIVDGKVPANSYVTLEATPDRVGAIRLRASKGNSGSRLAAARGAGDRLWLALPGDSFDHPYQHDDQVSGRLRKLDDVRYAGPLAQALRTFPTPRFITGAELRRAKAANATQVTLLDGATLAVTGTDEIDLAIADPGTAVVVAALSPGYAIPDWDAALTAAGLITAGQAPISATPDLVRWRVQRPDAVASVQAALDGAQLWGARAEVSTINVRGPWATFAASEAGVTGPGGELVPWSAIDVAGVWAPRTIPAGAWIILADERPGDYWYLQPIYGGLALIGLLALWALVRAVRREFFDRSAVAR
ncbi:MAG: hypothetical protein IPL61_26350 [Myxococcales bacterium]|nr:hypothetical protein [Myxococcales bacterium]